MKRGRPPLLNVTVKAWLSEYKAKHPDWSAKRIVDTLRRDLLANYRLKNPGKTPQEVAKYEASLKLPLPNTINHYFNSTEYQTSGDNMPRCWDSPWQLGLLEKFKEVSPEALLAISLVQRFCEIVVENPDPPFGEYPPLSVRQALWIAKLQPLAGFFESQRASSKEISKNNTAHNWRLLSLYRWSRAYSECERMARRAGVKLVDFSELDKGLRAGEIPIIAPSINFGGAVLSATGMVILLSPGSNSIRFASPDVEALDSLEEKIKKDGEIE